MELCLRCLKEIYLPRAAHPYAQHSCTAGLPCLSKECTAIVSVFTPDALHRWLNGAVAAQITLARNPEGSAVETIDGTPNKVTTWALKFGNFKFSRHAEPQPQRAQDSEAEQAGSV